MKKLTASVLVLVLGSSLAMVSAQTKKSDTAKTTEIGEVIITGALGIKKIADAVTSSQQVVSADQLNQASNPNAVQALTGKVAGLSIIQNNSSVNSSNTIQLRGLRSISSDNSALVVIDNVISSVSVLQGLPPDLIESINVIKGSQGAALYGSDGVNGVVIVTTKRGAKNRLSVTYTGSVDFESLAFIPKRQDKYGQGWDNARDQFENGAWGPAFDGSMTTYGLPLYDYNGDGTINTDGIGWGDPDHLSADNPAAINAPYIGRPNEIKNFFKTGATRSHSITLNAGSEGKYALVSINNTQRDFIVDGDKSNKTSFLFKGGVKLDKLSFDGGINYIRTDFSQTTSMYDDDTNSSLYWALLQSSPDIPITRYRNYSDIAYTYNIYYMNPYWKLKHARQDYSRDYFSANFGVGYEFNKHINLRYTGNLQGTYASSQSHRDAWSKAIYSGAAAGPMKTVTSSLFLSDTKSLDYYGDFLLNFDYDLTKDINAKLNLGHNYQEQRYQSIERGGANLAYPGVYTMANINQPLPFSSTFLENGTFRKNSHSLFANLDLAYKDFLFLNATARNEWVSKLPKANNSYFYPSVGLSFIPTKAFDFGGSVLNYFKISGGWSKVGNSRGIGWYDVNRTAEIAAGFPFNGVSSFRNGMVQTDPDLRPEFVTTSELNLDLGFFNDRVKVGGSIYKQDTKDMITDQTASSTSGINTRKINIAKMESKGAEINLGLVPIKTSDFKWEINGGYSYNESIVKEVLPGVADEIVLQTGTGWGIYAQKGSVFPLIKVNMMQRDDQGRIIIDAKTGNPLVTSTMQNAGSAVPKSIYNFSTNFSYKGFKLGVVGDYRFGSKFIADIKSGLAFNGSLWDSGEIDREKGGFIMPNSVISDGNGGYKPNTTVMTGGNDYAHAISYFSSFYATVGENLLTDGRAFKIREVSLSYTLPKSLISAYGLQEITIGTYARNPFQKFAKDNLNYADPEASFYTSGTRNTPLNARGVSNRGQLPSTKVYGFSLNVRF